MGLFTQQDPIGIAGGLNLYGYANGDPINFSDPFGLFACPPLCDSFDPEEDHFIRPESGAEAAGLIGMGLLAAAGGVALAAGAEAALGSQTVNLFRAVGQAELDDIVATGAFRAGPSSLGGKWFATTVDDAVAWGRALGGEFRVIQAQVSARAAEGMMHVKKLDGIGRAVYAELDELVGAVIRAIR